jgi:hypothetical protein
MGYYTAFNLTWEEVIKQNYNEEQDNLIEDIKNKMGDQAEFIIENINLERQTLDTIIGDYIENNSEMNYALHYDGTMKECSKWSDHEEDLMELSEKLPCVLFTLHGSGEDDDDLWIKYFYNGASQNARAKIVYDQPNFQTLGLPENYK